VASKVEKNTGPQRIGEILADMRFARPTQIRRALEKQTNEPGVQKIGEHLVSQQIIDEQQLLLALRVQKRVLREKVADEVRRKFAILVSETASDIRRPKIRYGWHDRVRNHLNRSPVLRWIKSLYI